MTATSYEGFLEGTLKSAFATRTQTRSALGKPEDRHHWPLAGGRAGSGHRVVRLGLPVPRARSDCLPDRVVWQIGRRDSFQGPPSPQCWTSAAARSWRPNFELESSPSTP